MTTTEVGPAPAVPAPPRRRSRPDPLTVTGAVVLAVLATAALAGPSVLPHGPAEQDHAVRLAPPSAQHWLGTARLGEDVLAQCLSGLRKSLAIGSLVAVLSTALAAVVGTLAACCGGRVDRALMWGVDVLLVLPAFLVVAVVSPAVRGRHWLALALLIALFQWMLSARVVRARAASLRRREFVLAAECSGASTPHVIRAHLLPNTAALLVVDCTLAVGAAVVGEAALSYVGLGVRPPEVSLGTLIATGASSALTYEWLFLAPVVFLVTTVMAVGLLGEGLRRSLAEDGGTSA